MGYTWISACTVQNSENVNIVIKDVPHRYIPYKVIFGTYMRVCKYIYNINTTMDFSVKRAILAWSGLFFHAAQVYLKFVQPIQPELNGVCSRMRHQSFCQSFGESPNLVVVVGHLL